MISSLNSLRGGPSALFLARLSRSYRQRAGLQKKDRRLLIVGWFSSLFRTVLNVCPVCIKWSSFKGGCLSTIQSSPRFSSRMTKWYVASGDSRRTTQCRLWPLKSAVLYFQLKRAYSVLLGLKTRPLDFVQVYNLFITTSLRSVIVDDPRFYTT